MSDTHERLRCPQCQATMQTGFIPISQGMHFIRGDGKAAHHFAENLPGTHAIMRTNKLLAWRCKACEMVIFKYGRENAKHVQRILTEIEAPLDPLEEEVQEQADTLRRGLK